MTKYRFILLCIFLCLFFYSSSYGREIKILFSMHDSDVNYHMDTIYFDRNETGVLSFFRDTVFLNGKMIYHFEQVEYYLHIAYIESAKKRYLYIYPSYYERGGPYVWYELGVFIELKHNGKTKIREGYNYFDDDEFSRLFKRQKSLE